MKKRLLFLIAVIIACVSIAQEKSKIKFGSVKPEDFQTKIYSIDSNAAAVVIADIGSTEIIGNTKGSFSLLFKNFRRAHILSKNGYDIGNVEIELFTNGDKEEELENLKAVTYNLEKGKVIETKLEIKSAVFKDRINKNKTIRKFTFPNIKEGSIIEYEYRIMSDFVFNLQPWEFQGQYPRLWSEYNVAIPEFYNYVTLSQGYHPYAIKDQKERRDNFTMADTRGAAGPDRSSFTASVTDYRWVMKDIPALKEESFTSTLRNHISRIEFQLQAIRDPFPYQPVMATWANVAKDLLADEGFGLQLKRDNGWLNEVIPVALKTTTSGVEKAKIIYAWVRDNFTCTVRGGKYLSKSLRNVLKDRNGSAAEINLLLTAMLRKADLPADPVMLSTRSHGYPHTIYPLMDRFNYVICRTEIDGQEIYLDASWPLHGFGKLGTECYNGHARIINESATAVDLDPDTLKETESTTVFMINDGNGRSVGSMQHAPGYYKSYRYRNRIKEKGKEQVMKDIEKAFGADIKTSSERFDSLEKYDEPLVVFYDFEMPLFEDEIVYLNPMFGQGYKENPFKPAQRFYPVEMPYTLDELFTLQLEVPAGYVVDELPKQAVVKFNEEEDAIFEYRISQTGNSVSVRSRLRVKKTWFDPQEYETLRDFFNFVVKKHSEQIVLKKKK